MARRPSIKSPCVADRYNTNPRERTAEFSSGCIEGAGGLIALRDEPDTLGQPPCIVLNLWRLEKVRVHVAADVLGPKSLRAAAQLWMEQNPDKSPNIFHPEPGELEALREIAHAAKDALQYVKATQAGLKTSRRLGGLLVAYNGAPFAFQGKLNPTGEPYNPPAL